MTKVKPKPKVKVDRVDGVTYFYYLFIYIMRHIDSLFDDNRHMLEKSVFGVCQYAGEKMGIKPETIRMYFIYSSFITFGSPLVLYLAAAFWINIRKYIQKNDGAILEK